ncbi:hypothetical protein niasHT_029721 [Heterodera trifolii]|uniref:Secreted protein n=1 Tax=Heterodera trifolii TaxID=157864 RepID=A0ABD2KQM8_9BILA
MLSLLCVFAILLGFHSAYVNAGCVCGKEQDQSGTLRRTGSIQTLRSRGTWSVAVCAWDANAQRCQATRLPNGPDPRDRNSWRWVEECQQQDEEYCSQMLFNLCIWYNNSCELDTSPNGKVTSWAMF